MSAPDRHPLMPSCSRHLRHVISAALVGALVGAVALFPFRVTAAQSASSQAAAAQAALQAAAILDAAPAEEAVRRAPVPFAVGESFQFKLQAKWFLIRGGGTASLGVQAIDTVHGFPSYQLQFATKGGITVFKMNDVQRSWLDVQTLFARRFEQKLDQTGYSRDKTYEFIPEDMRFVNLANPADTGTLASAEPLDDVSFIYYIRTLPMVVGKTYTAARYFKEQGNPVTVQVLRTERITVPAGEFDAIVVRPIIRTKGLFSEGGQAEVWFSNDERRIPLKVKAKVSIATLTMELQSYTMGTP